MLPTPQVIAAAQTVLSGGNFAFTYLFPDAMVDNMFTLKKQGKKERSLVRTSNCCAHLLLPACHNPTNT